MMTYHHPGRNSPVGQLPADPMYGNAFASSSADDHVSIAGSATNTDPFPAVITSSNPGPETL